jgi:transposase InsO family protein
MKAVFARYGIPEMVRSDNGPQYSSDEFKLFSLDYGFKHTSSSPGHSSGNGMAERAVQTVKNLIKQSDPYIALLNYRHTPLANGYSPAQLLMSKRIRTKVPIANVQLQPKVVDYEHLLNFKENSKLQQSFNFDRRHAAKVLSELQENDTVFIPDRKQFGSVNEKFTSNSYIVQTPTDNTEETVLC